MDRERSQNNRGGYRGVNTNTDQNSGFLASSNIDVYSEIQGFFTEGKINDIQKYTLHSSFICIIAEKEQTQDNEAYAASECFLSKTPFDCFIDSGASESFTDQKQ